MPWLYIKNTTTVPLISSLHVLFRWTMRTVVRMFMRPKKEPSFRWNGPHPRPFMRTNLPSNLTSGLLGSCCMKLWLLDRCLIQVRLSNISLHFLGMLIMLRWSFVGIIQSSRKKKNWLWQTRVNSFESDSSLKLDIFIWLLWFGYCWERLIYGSGIGTSFVPIP